MAKKKSKVAVKLKPDPAAIDTVQMARSIFEKVRAIKAANPAVARKVDRSESEIRKLLEKIHADIGKLDRHDRDLVAIMVINGLYKAADEILVEE